MKSLVTDLAEVARRGGLVLLLSLSGCMGPDKAELAELIPINANIFEYHVLTNPFLPATADTSAEWMRLAWLATDMQTSQLCGDRYELTSRRVVFLYQAPNGSPVDQVVYRGRCQG